ncbi:MULTISPECIES: hypothetical protein [unclassified Actinoplanes]|uniref:hypothetical protein n=1 Tax=unclassified Actinoplanes TaxID=2626549 RepID=UPI0005BDA54C|nr:MULTISPECIES: hypothetical protein [unclassified Actinoplanes]
MSSNPHDGEPSSAAPVWSGPPAMYPAHPAAAFPPGPPGSWPPGLPSYAVAHPPRRSSRTAWIIGSAVVAMLLVVCGGIGAVAYTVRDHQPKRTVAVGEPTVSPGAEDDPEPAPGPTHPGDLAQYLIPAPKGSRKWPTAPADQALADSAAMSKLVAKPAAFQAVLDRYEFRRGFARRWIDGRSLIVDVRAFQFEGTGNARYFADFQQASLRFAGYGEPVPVAGADDTSAQVQPKKDKIGRIRSSGLVVRADMVVMIDTYALPPNDPKALDALLLQESRLLP